ncbi:hypothetical protein GCM10009547_18880 [Sporichthya brevicatena]|uniref:Linalool dehydratase/isomerase domain-containing protein n=1 Tax=Sporichthya brevicatena TaxID=171442 RepID=A0ABP3RTW8_9ACTN
MTTLAHPNAEADLLISPRTGGGPVGRARRRRSVAVWVVLCVLGALPSLLDAGAGWQAAGLGMFFPGAGFLAAEGWMVALVLPCLLLMGIAWVAWFGSGMVVAPVIVWLGSAAAAGALVGDTTDAGLPIVAAVTVAGLLGGVVASRAQQRKAVARREARNTVLPAQLDEVNAIRARAIAAPKAPEMSAEQLKGIRYAIRLAMQPKEDWTGFNRVDQFQTSALRYQINQLGWLLALAQSRYAPSHHGELSESQIRLVERYLQKEVCSYWRYERAWGHLRLDADPIVRDNIMLTGYIGLNLALYEGNTGDFRWDAPDALPFAVGKRRIYPHSSLDVRDSLLENYGRHTDDYCLFPCEPNWIYPACNFRGAVTLAGYDRARGTDHWSQLRDAFRAKLEAEFMRPDGTCISLRSEHTGFAVPFPMPDSVLAKELNAVLPELAHRYWALVRHELLPVIDGERRIILDKANVDFGNYTLSDAFALACYHGSAREMGDYEVADLAMARLLDVLEWDETETYFPGRSTLVNATIATDRLLEVDAWRTAITVPTDPKILSGPILGRAGFPEVLVAAARSDGAALDLVLSARTPGEYELHFERLRPTARYRLTSGTAGTGVEVTADAAGTARATAALDIRTELRLTPAP